MTAFILAPYADRVEILSDGAEYTPDGVLLGVADKVITSDVIPLAMVGSGAVADIRAIADVILRAAATTGSVDSTLEILAGAVAEIGQSPNFDTGLRMAIGAISETRGPVCLVFSTFEDQAGGARPFELQEMGRCFAQGAAPSGEDLAAYGPLDVFCGLAKDGVFLMEAMRKQKMVNPAKPDREPVYSVGGHVDLTIIRTEGYQRRRLITWPDVVGEKIDPLTGQLAA
jgi:hypothetical protein